MVIKHVISMCLTLSLCTLLKALKNKPKSSFCKKKKDLQIWSRLQRCVGIQCVTSHNNNYNPQQADLLCG